MTRRQKKNLYGTDTAGDAVYSKPRVFQSAFCVSCANRDDPIAAACSVCRSGKNGRPTEYRKESENGENQLGESGGDLH